MTLDKEQRSSLDKAASEIVSDSLSVDELNGGVTSTKITDLEGPGIRANGSNELESDVATYSEESANRSLGSWETNNTGNPLEVKVTVSVGTNNASADDLIEVRGHVSSSQSNRYVGRKTVQTSDGSFMSVSVSFTVADGDEYKVVLQNDTTNNASIDKWMEAERGAS